MEELYQQAMALMFLAITVGFGLMVKYLITYLKESGILAKLKSNKDIVYLVVKNVEQLYTHLHGEEKFNMAKLEILKLLKEKGIKISSREIDLLIESCVHEMNAQLKKGLENK